MASNGLEENSTQTEQNGYNATSNGSVSSKTSIDDDLRRKELISSLQNHDSNSAESLAEEGEQLLGGVRRRVAVFVEMLLIFAVYLSLALLAPFFPIKAKEKGLSLVSIGLLFACFAAISAIFSMLISRWLHMIGPKSGIVLGAFLVGGCTILIGPQKDVPMETNFFWSSLATFVVWAIGHAATNTSCSALMSFHFPGNEAILYSIMDAALELGFLFGGPIGSGFYVLGGYTLPFYVFGGLIILMVVFSLLIEPSFEVLPQEKSYACYLLCVPSVWTTCLALMTTFTLFGIITVGLAIHLTDHFDVAKEYTGFFWVLSGVTKMVTATLLRTMVGNNSAAARLILIVGQVLGCITFIFIGPSTIARNLPNKLAVVCIGFAFEGVVKACVIVPTLVDLTITLRATGLPDRFKTQSAIAGLFWGVFSFGTFVGPILGGLLIHFYGFVGACNIGAVVFAVVAAILSVYLSWEFRCGKGRREQYTFCNRLYSDLPGEETPMLVSQK